MTLASLDADCSSQSYLPNFIAPRRFLVQARVELFLGVVYRYYPYLSIDFLNYSVKIREITTAKHPDPCI